YLLRPAVADPKKRSQLLYAHSAALVGRQKLPPQIIIKGSRHSYRVAENRHHNITSALKML
ncbi:MAG TPA: hypothetical protein VM578_10530, partial [Candidatus Saccharimonadales bacterium]|nr:hypothetical protein [Candidatus Saccharimonadales bacterium]